MSLDTTNPDNTLKLQLNTMRKGNTKVVYQLASPSNRMVTASGGYNYEEFDKMVRSPTYLPLLYFQKYKTLQKKQLKNKYIADILIYKKGRSYKFRFVMSLQKKSVVDNDNSLIPFQMTPGHSPVWRTDSVIPIEI